MKRFVDMRDSDIEGVRFAFWCTVLSVFETFDGAQGWHDMDDFMEATECEPDREEVARLVVLMPSWARRKPYE